MYYTLAYICAAFTAGAFCITKFSINTNCIVLFAALFFLIAAVIYGIVKNRWNFLITMVLIEVAFLSSVVYGLFYTNIHLSITQPIYNTKISVKGEISYENGYLLIHTKEINEKEVKHYIKICCYPFDGESYNVGDLVTVYGMFKPFSQPAYYGDYNSYVSNISKFTYGMIENPEIIVTGHKTSFNSIGANIRKIISERTDSVMSGDDAALLKALLIGCKDDFTDEMKENLMKSSLSHIAVVSGVHVSVFISMLGIFVAFLKKYRRIYILISLSTILFLLCVIGCQPSVLRAVIMATYCVLTVGLYKRYDILTAFLFSAAVLTIINPYYTQSVSYQLSYAATLGIILGLIKDDRKVFYTSFSIFILLMPMCLYYFGFVSFSIFFTNLLVSPIIAMVIPLGLLMQIFPFLHGIVGFLLKIILVVAETFSKTEILHINTAIPSAILLCSMYLVVIAFFVFTVLKKKRIAAILLAMCILLGGTDFFINKNTTVITVFDGCSNVIHINTVCNKNIICTTDFNSALEYIDKNNLKTIDILYLTYFPNELKQIDNLCIKKICVPKVDGKKLIADACIKCYTDEPVAIDGVALIPVSYMPYKKNKNERHSVVKIVTKEISILFEPYDSQTLNIKRLSDISADVVVLGNKTKNQSEFLNNISPSIVIADSLQLTDDMLYSIYETQYCGSVSFLLKHNRYTVKTLR